MPKILALDTATEACSAALWLDGELVERISVIQRGHAEHILPMVDELLAAAQLAASALDAVAVTRGPGAFTGVRIGVSVAQGLAFGWGLPVVPVSTLAALASGVLERALVAGADACLSALDARMGELYLGFHTIENGELVSLEEERLLAPTAITEDMLAGRRWCGVGRGWEHLAGLASSSRVLQVFGDDLPSAGHVARLAAAAFARGELVAPERLEPVYLRDKVTS